MAPPIYCEGFSTPEPLVPVSRRYADVTRRLARLEEMAADPVRVARLIAHGRYLRLCAAIAWASATVDREHVRLNVASAGSAVVFH